MVSETFLKPGHHLSIANYNIYPRDSNNGPVGGTAVIIKRNIDHCELTDPQLIEAEANGIAVTLHNGEKLQIYSFYSPGARRPVPEDLTTITETNGDLIVAGDFNAKYPSWNSRTTNSNGTTLGNHADQHLYEIFGPQEPTHFSIQHAADSIDLAIAKTSGNKWNWKSHTMTATTTQ